MAKYYELTEHDVVATVLTDSAVMYDSRIRSWMSSTAPIRQLKAAVDYYQHMHGIRTDSMLELSYEDRKRIHNLKYYTWVEQQGKDVEELNALWYDTEGTWDAVHKQAAELDELIDAFNEASGVLKSM